MVVPLDSPQPTFILPPVTQIPDTDEDKPEVSDCLNEVGVFQLPELIFGSASFSTMYNPESTLTSDIPLRTVRLVLRYGICAFDTSAYYGPSEIVLGTALKALLPEFPRSSYKIMTKCGRYGRDRASFDYSPNTIRRSIDRSLARLHTNYLDVVYLHDVEYVATAVMPSNSGDHTAALGSSASVYGLGEGDEGTIRGLGDEEILAAVAELRKMQAEGLIRHIGISGYPLPTLLRLAILVLYTTPYKPLDIILSYSHSNLQNNTFDDYVTAFRTRAQVTQLVAASPLSMGLLTDSPPSWHPAPAPLLDAKQKASELCSSWPGGLPNVALGYAFRGQTAENAIPTVVGLSSPREVHESIRVLNALKKATEDEDKARRKIETDVVELFKASGFHGWSWASPPEHWS